jgi:hypothetical protein
VIAFANRPDVDAIASFLFGAAICILQQAPCYALLIEKTYGCEDRNLQLFARVVSRADKHEAQTANNACRVDHREPSLPKFFGGRRCLPLDQINTWKEVPNDCVSTSNV